MRSGKKIGVIVLAVLVTLVSGGALSRVWADNCNTGFFTGLNLTDEEGNPVTNLAATSVAAASPLPAYCNVTGTLYPMINFQVALPTTTAWNGRFYMAGGGGFNGSIPSLTTGLSLNYATAGTDSGHTGTPLDASFAYNPPTTATLTRR